MPINLIKSKSDESNQNCVTGIDVIVRVCAALINMNTGIFRKDEENTVTCPAGL